MSIEEGVESELEEIKKQVIEIRDNHLMHVNARLDKLEDRLRAPLSSLYLLGVFAVFIAVVVFVSLPASIAWPVAGVCSVILVLVGIGIRRLVKTKSG